MQLARPWSGECTGRKGLTNWLWAKKCPKKPICCATVRGQRMGDLQRPCGIPLQYCLFTADFQRQRSRVGADRGWGLTRPLLFPALLCYPTLRPSQICYHPSLTCSLLSSQLRIVRRQTLTSRMPTFIPSVSTNSFPMFLALLPVSCRIPEKQKRKPVSVVPKTQFESAWKQWMVNRS